MLYLIFFFLFQFIFNFLIGIFFKPGKFNFKTAYFYSARLFKNKFKISLHPTPILITILPTSPLFFFCADCPRDHVSNRCLSLPIAVSLWQSLRMSIIKLFGHMPSKRIITFQRLS